MKEEFPKRLDLPAAVLDITILSFRVSLPEIENAYGSAHQESSDPLAVPGPTLYWGLEYTCGLRIILEFLLSKDFLYVCADSPEMEHILDHLSLPIKDLWQLASDDETLIKYFPKSNYVWTLWRQDDNGYKELIKKFGWEREAQCRLRQFEKLHHKQTYWLESEKTG